MKILLVSATSFEIAPVLQKLDDSWEKPSFFEYRIGEVSVFPLVTGVGPVHTAFALARYQDMGDVDLAINAGVAGSLRPEIPLGEVLEVFEDRFADLGVEENDGSFSDVFDLQLHNANAFPYTNGWISNADARYDAALQRVRGITVSKVHGHESSISQIKAKYAADVESMEGAAFLYACRALDVDALQIRSISNYVEPRNRANWKIDLAIDNLNDVLLSMIDKLGAEGPKRTD